jgi:hypothetical protein
MSRAHGPGSLLRGDGRKDVEIAVFFEKPGCVRSDVQHAR